MINRELLESTANPPFVINTPELSNWRVHIVPNGGMVVYPPKGSVPNWFWRWTQRVILGFQWEKMA